MIYGLSKRDNRSLDGTPLGQPSGRDAPSFSNVKVTQCPAKMQFIQIIKIKYLFLYKFKLSQINSKILYLMTKLLVLNF